MDRENGLNIPDHMLIVALDGDGIGRMVGRAIIANDPDQLHKVSARIDAAQEFILHWVKQNDGIKISGGGDEAVIAIPASYEYKIQDLRQDIEQSFGYTISVGVGKSLSEAGTALLVAKLRGKDQTIRFSNDLKNEIKKAKRRVREKRATQEEYKLSEAYLEKAENNMEKDKSELQDCQYCKQTDGVDPDHCKYCHDSEPTTNEESCPYCTQGEGVANQAEPLECPYCKEAPEEADACPYCKDDAPSGQKMPEVAEQDNHAAEQKGRITSPDSGNQSAPAGSPEEKEQANTMGMNPPINGKPEIGDASPAGIGSANPSDAGAPMESPEENKIITEEGAHSKEALQAIAEQIESETVDGNPEDRQEAKQIDDADLAAVDNTTEENVSRPAGYDNNTPEDMGLGEEEVPEEGPDLNEVLQGGLDAHADNIQREKVVQMASQALEGFKASKDVLEKAKEQAPQLYQASLLMLKSMIEMAKMLGFGDQGAENSEGPIGPQGDKIIDELSGEGKTDGKDEWSDPFPKHPDHGGERKPGHAPSKEEGAEAPKDHKTIGQSAGKLSSKHTTKHVARTTMPPGAVNAKGQQKIVTKDGKTRWIDRKQGMVQSTQGIPIKPPNRIEDDNPNKPKKQV